MFAHIGKIPYLCRRERKKNQPLNTIIMNYPVRCTWCISQLKNTKHYRDAHYYMSEREMYIDVQTRAEANAIEMLNGYLEGAFKVYKDILNMNEEGDELC